jgi:hypothetical protein
MTKENGPGAGDAKAAGLKIRDSDVPQSTPSTANFKLATDGAIIGLDIRRAWPCRCGCPLTRIAYHSIKSTKLILRCPWCRTRRRRGHPTKADVKALKDFVHKHGWNMRPIVIGEDGVAYVN